MGGKAGDVRKPVVLGPGDGRPYEMGGMQAVFKADGAATQSRYNVSEWWLDPHTQGPGAHSHDEDDIFYVIEGTLDFLVDDEWTTAPAAPSCSSPVASHTRSGTRATYVQEP
jgi:quercetin dioxygenase-like cupin family protein